MKCNWVAVIVLMVFVMVPAFAGEETSDEAARAGVTAPRLIKFSGTMKDSAGFPRAGQVVVTFTLYGSQEGGESLWRESQLVRVDDEGIYTVFLGASEEEGLPLELFSTGKAQWLGVQAEWEEEQGRILLVAVPYALKAADADTVGGKPVSSFVLNEDLLEAGGDFDAYSALLAQRGITIRDGKAAARSSSSGISGGILVLQPSGGVPINADRIGTDFVLAGNEIGNNTWYGEFAGNTGLGSNNSSFGQYSGFVNVASGNSFFGQDSGRNNTSGTGLAFFGYQAGRANITSSDNTFFGSQAGLATTNNANVFVGSRAGDENTTGHNNSFLGFDAGDNNTIGSGNSFFGDWVARGNTTGSSNSYFGNQAGSLNTTENGNSCFGAYCQTAVGISNATALGFLASVTQSNSLVLGSINGINGASADTSVGIGISNPDRQLVVEGGQALLRFKRYFGTPDPFTSTFGPALLLQRARGSRGAEADILPGDNLGKLQFEGSVGASMLTYGMLAFIANDTSKNGRFAFVDRDLVTERVSILNTGNMGIGTTAPTERLEVVGNIKLSGSILYEAAGAEIPDYVFEPDYSLMPIGELERYIAREKHLPNVPKASEIKEKGLNLSEFQMKMLEKIEELTLYTVQQAKTIEHKDAEIEILKSQNSNLDARLAAIEQQLNKEVRK
jgi:hypothetical protein